MSDPVEFSASIAPTDGSLKAHGLEGFRMVLDIPESETPAYVRLLLCRGHALRVTVQIDGERRPAARKRKPGRGKPRTLTEAEWGDDGDEDETG